MPRQRRRGFGLLCAWALAATANAVQDLEAVMPFDLPAQPLADSLRAVGTQAGLNVLFDPPAVRDRVAPALRASLTSGQAFARLLVDSGLRFEFIGDRTVAIRAASSPDGEPDAPGATKSGGRSESEISAVARLGHEATLAHAPADTAAQPERLEEILVTSHPFKEGEISKSGIPLLQTPQAISVVSAESIKARGVTDLNDAMRVVSGVSHSSTYGFYDAYTIRGYDTAYDSLYQDGLFTYSEPAGTNHELAGLERVEVLKGPASSLYGAAPIGGIVNLVSKRPRPDSFLDVGVSSGSYGLIEAVVDANAPLSGQGALLGRLNAVYRDSDDFIPNSGRNRVFIAPALTVNFGPDSHLTILGRWWRDRDNPWSDLPSEGTVLPNANGPIPYDFTVHLPGDRRGVIDQDTRQIGYVLDHPFSAELAFSQSLRYSRQKAFYTDWVYANGYADSRYVDGVQQGHLIGLYVFGPARMANEVFSVDSRLTWKLGAGWMRHQIITGVEYRELRSDYEDTGSNYDITANTLDYLDVDYGGDWIHDPIAGASAFTAATHQNGAYVQDHVSLGERLFVTLGGRWDRVASDASWRERNRAKDFSPRIGVSFLFAPGTSVYASWSKSFLPQFPWIRSFDGLPVDNGKGHNREIGVKLSNGNTLTGAAALFQLERTHVPTVDPLHPRFHVITGRQRCEGIELEGIWTPRPGWHASLAYTFLDAEVTEDNAIPIGTRLGNVPRHNVYARSGYSVTGGPLDGLSADLALLWNSDKVGDTSAFVDADGDGDNDSDIPLSGYVLVDAGVAFERAQWRWSLRVSNLFDRRYFPEASQYTRVVRGEPRAWRLSLSKRFQ
jgi:iron complex outermembrane receptor protein